MEGRFLGYAALAKHVLPFFALRPALVTLPILVPKQARMGRQITADAGNQKTRRSYCEWVSLPQTEGVLLLPRFAPPYWIVEHGL